MGTARVAMVLGVMLALGAAELPAQRSRPGLRPVRERAYVGGGLVLALPSGEFADFVEAGGGLVGHTVLNFDRHGAVGLRFDAGFVIYGAERQLVPLSPTVRRVLVDVTTTNSIISLGVGPQVVLGRGPVRPYGYWGIGLSYFATESSVSGSRDFFDFASTTNFDDLTFAWHTGGGLRIGVSRGRTPIAIDLGARYVANGRARYLVEGSIQETPDGGLRITAIESDANFVLLQLGVSATLF